MSHSLRGTEYGLCGRRKWESLHPGVSCFVCKPRAGDQTPLWRRSPGYCPVGKKWSQGRGERSLLSLGLAVKPPIPAACTSVPAPSPPPTQGRPPGMLHALLTTILSANTPKRRLPTPSDHLVSYDFGPPGPSDVSRLALLLLPGNLRD